MGGSCSEIWSRRSTENRLTCGGRPPVAAKTSYLSCQYPNPTPFPKPRLRRVKRMRSQLKSTDWLHKFPSAIYELLPYQFLHNCYTAKLLKHSMLQQAYCLVQGFPLVSLGRADDGFKPRPWGTRKILHNIQQLVGRVYIFKACDAWRVQVDRWRHEAP